MAKPYGSQAPTMGDEALAKIIPTLKDAIAIIEDSTAARLCKLRAAAEEISALPKDSAIPDQILRTLQSEALDEYFNCREEETPQVIAMLGNLTVYAEGIFIVDEAGNFVDREDYAIEQMRRRIAAIDWSSEPDDEDERTLRDSIIAEVMQQNTELWKARRALTALCDGEPASDLANALEHVSQQYRCETSSANARATAQMQYGLARDLAKRTLNAVGATA